MLIRYSVENFLSFNQRTEFSMIPGKGSLKKEHKAPAINGVSVLKTSIILGAMHLANRISSRPWLSGDSWL